MGIPITRQQECCFTTPPTVVNTHLPILSQETKPYTHSCLWPYSERGAPPSLTHVRVSLLLTPAPGLCFCDSPLHWTHPTTQMLRTIALARDPGFMCSPPPQPSAASSFLKVLPRHPYHLFSGSFSLSSGVSSLFSFLSGSFPCSWCSKPAFGPRPPFFTPHSLLWRVGT